MAEVPDDFKPPEVLREHSRRVLQHHFRRPLCVAWIDEAVRKQRSGFHNPAQDRQGYWSPGAAKEFKANILCRDHNSALSPADDAALAFATFLRRNALQYDAGAGEWGDAEEITISGDDMQRWVSRCS